MKKVCILDYGSGNTRSVYNLVKTISNNVVISNEIEDINSSTHIILPGVGAYSSAMQKINHKIPIDNLIYNILTIKKPFLGICVGMQVLSTFGFEFDKTKGLNWIEGEVIKIELQDKKLNLPHVGWNSVVKLKDDGNILKNIENETDFYFVHSFEFIPINHSHVTAICNYGKNIVAVLNKDNIYGVQFHPEKSQDAGKKLLENFINI
jgi:glutamine amidotransferase